MFSLVQHSRDLLLFETLIQFLGYGTFVKEKNNDVVRLRVENFSNIDEKLIPFFTKYPKQSNKYLDYLDFKKACTLKKEKAHLTEEGISLISDLQGQRNNHRLTTHKSSKVI